jgi:hypothetical protein
MDLHCGLRDAIAVLALGSCSRHQVVSADPSPSSVGGSTSIASPARAVVAGSLCGLALVSLGVGIGFGVGSINVSHSADDLNAQRGGVPCPQAGASLCSNLQNERSTQSQDSTIAAVLYVSAGKLAAGAVAAWFLWPKRSEAKSTWIAPSVTARAAGVTMMGSF